VLGAVVACKIQSCRSQGAFPCCPGKVFLEYQFDVVTVRSDYTLNSSTVGSSFNFYTSILKTVAMKIGAP
jgi:hypothetical protein